MPHKFKVGQTVEFIPTGRSAMPAGHVYEIMRCLPIEQGQYGYRIKSKTEAFERIAKESELERRR